MKEPHLISKKKYSHVFFYFIHLFVRLYHFVLKNDCSGSFLSCFLFWSFLLHFIYLLFLLPVRKDKIGRLCLFFFSVSFFSPCHKFKDSLFNKSQGLLVILGKKKKWLTKCLVFISLLFFSLLFFIFPLILSFYLFSFCLFTPPPYCFFSYFNQISSPL